MIKILASRKEDFHSDYTLEKEQEFFAGFRQFLIDSGFNTHDYEITHFGKAQGDYGELDSTKDMDIKTLNDKYVFLGNEEYSIDIVYGIDKIFVIINTKKDYQ